MSDNLTPVIRERTRGAVGRVAETFAALIVSALLAIPAAPQTPAGESAIDRATLRVNRLIADAGGQVSAGQIAGYPELGREAFRSAVSSGLLPAVVKFRLVAAYDTAVKKLHEEPGCRALFAQLGVNGEEVLARSHYADGGTGGTCQGEVRAFTCIGCTQVKLCPSFGSLGVSGATVLLLHEALHTAGLKESPAYPTAMTAREINGVVIQGCRLWW